MFKVGQTVWHIRNQRSGTVQECDGDRVYLVQDNGAELDFPASELSETPPANASRPRPADHGEAARATGPAPVRALTPRDITPEHLKVLSTVPLRTLQAVASLYERRPRAGKFSALEPHQKLNLLTEITAVPYRVMRDYLGRPGELGMLMGKGLADSQRSG